VNDLSPSSTTMVPAWRVANQSDAFTTLASKGFGDRVAQCVSSSRVPLMGHALGL
jgi:hypothetical protein